ncbi:MAG: alpha/beta hydrolase [Chloroflexi bacterium]|nr:alpha/beta hydrolase [Chloroflexota bacterium]
MRQAAVAPLRDSARPALRWLWRVGSCLAFALAACAGAREAAPATAYSTTERVPTGDGTSLDARLFQSNTRRLAIFVHGYGGSQRDWFPVARELATSDQASALTFDFRGYGASDGKRSTGTELVSDVLAVVAYARARGFHPMVLVGSSMGASAAIIAASAEPEVDGVIALSPPASFGELDVLRAIERRRPAMALIAARGDPSAVDSLQTIARHAGLPARYARLVEGSAHGTAMLDSVSGIVVRRQIDSLLREMWDSP